MVHQRYKNVIDLIDEDGSMYDFQKLKEVYEIHGTYLDYLHLINRIPRLWNENSTKMPHISIMCKLTVTYLTCYAKGEDAEIYTIYTIYTIKLSQ